MLRAVVVLLALVLTACSADPPPDAAAAAAPVSGVAPQELPGGYGSTAADGEFPRDVVHFGGTTTLPAEPQRVVVISTGQLDGVLSLGVVPVGATQASGAGLVPAYLADAFPDADLTSVGSVGLRLEPDLEAIAALQPDLVLVNTVGAEPIGAALSGIAPTVVTEGTGVNWQQDLLLVAAALGRTAAAQDLLQDLLDDAAQVGAGFGDATASVVRVSGDRTRIWGTGSFVGSILAAGDVARPADQRFTGTSQDLSDEELQRAAGDRLFYGVQAGAEDATALASPLWTGLPAIADGTAVRVDDEAWFLNAGPAAARVVLDQLAG
ncbi:ABC transporter substrate-binding protein [Klenkia taihuensis]|uniref:Iron complex transport system substrate-binding protein n=1 Tax=Klenkia taihuensis TaxID=1225127 RepID=A0A1I1HIJ5_9ACTN|nr:ABC transporter substrate-binding protein [Klenkia taihuensis]GHE09160.1 iron ABC transporter substrate-binding protein [Klenkia taihuensis]SFC23636.1 iron complex transport system substrate-binding protein [Klenkia taihuensis]